MAAGRVVTLLFTDLVGSTELFQRLGEEQAETFRRAHFGLLRAAVETHGGEEVKNLGDGIMATFPTEPDALRAAVAMQQAVDSESSIGNGPAATIRVGLHTGETVQVDDDHFGTAVIVAKRLCDTAAPGQILASEVTVDRVGEGGASPWRSLGRLQLKGLAEPVATVEVIWRAAEMTGPSEAGPALFGRVVRPPGLSPPPDAFVGRHTELGKLAGMLLSARLVTLTGPGGVGKTRLCGHLVDLVASRYPDGVWGCALASLTADGDVAAAVATMLRIDRRSDVTLEERLVEFLSPKNALVVLDNCEQVIDGASELTAAILGGTRRVDVLVTSREPLGIAGEHRMALEPLTVPEGYDEPGLAPAVSLFVQRATAADPEFSLHGGNRREVYDLCRRLDGLPLAIELAAASLGSRTVTELAAEVAERFEQLGVRRGRPERHRSIAAMVEWSYDLLEPDDRRLFEWLSVFVGGWNADVLAAMTSGRPAPRLKEALDRLVDQSLVSTRRQHDLTRYALLEPIRAYAEHRLRRRGGYDEAREAHARWCLQLWENAATGLHGPEAGRWVARLEQELNNLRAAQSWFVETGNAEGALRPTEAWFFFGIASGVSEVFAWARTAAEAFSQTGHPSLPGAWAAAATGPWLGGDLERASGMARRGLAEAASGSGAGRYPLYLLGVIAIIAGDFTGAQEHLLRAAALCDAEGDHMLGPYALGGCALAMAYAGQRAEAEKMAGRALAIAEADQNPGVLAWALYCAGEIRLDRAPNEARDYLVRSLEAAEGSSRFVLGVAGLSLASLDVRHGDPVEALGRYPGLIEHFQRAGSRIQQWITIRNLIQALPDAGNAEAAAVLYGALGASATAPPVAGEDHRRLAAVVERLRSEMGGAEFARHRDRGAGLDDAGAVAFATETLRHLLA